MMPAFRQRYGMAIAFPSIPAMRANIASVRRSEPQRRLRALNASHNWVPIGKRVFTRKITPVDNMIVTGRGGVLGAAPVPTSRDRMARRWYADYWRWRAELRHWGCG